MLYGIVTSLVLSSPASVRADDAEAASAKWVESVGGKITRDDKVPGKPVVEVELGVNTKVTDDGLKELKGFKNARSLSLFLNRHITDKGIVHVKSLPALESLNFSSIGITDAGVAELKDLKKLKSLALAGCVGITDKSTETIKEFAALEELSLPSSITAKGVANLTGLKKLRSLSLAGCTKLTDAAIKDIAENLPELEYLVVSATDGTQITDASILHFTQLKKLKSLRVGGSKITFQGVKALRDAMPNCTITK